MKIAIECLYTASTTVTFDLPDGKTWDDVTGWYVKWGMVYVAFNGGEYQELGEMGEASLASVDFKRPDRSTVYAIVDNEMELPDYDNELATQE
jgi:hypothetical protein